MLLCTERRWHAFLFVIFACCVGSLQATAQALKVGASVVDVTPEKFPVLVNGGFLPRSESEVKTPVNARAIVIQSGSKMVAVMVVDSCMLPQELLDDVKQRVAMQTDLKANHICISATHTHTAPSAARALGTDWDSDYVPFLRDKLIQALLQAMDRLQPAEMGWGSLMAPEYTALRRWVRRPDRVEVDPFGNKTVRANMHAARDLNNVTGESGPEDPELSMIAFRSPDGTPIAALANFSMHYYGDSQISADYFGLFCEGFQTQVQNQYPDSDFVAVMSHGCSGDIWRRDYRTWNGKDSSKINTFADGLRQKAVQLLSTVSWQADIELEMEEVRLPMKYRVPDAQRLQWAERVLENMSTENPVERFEVYAREQVYLHQLQEAEVVVQAIRLGDIGIATTPCETYALTGLKFKKQSPFQHQMVIELANGALGYIPPPEQHFLGGYNTWAARSAGLEASAEPRIVATGLSMLERLAGKPRHSTAEESGPAADEIHRREPLAYFRMADMAGPIAVDSGSMGRHGVYEPGVAFYLNGSDRKAFTSDDVNRSAFFCGGRMQVRMPNLPQEFTLRMEIWNGMPVDARSVTGWFFSRDHSAALTTNGLHLGIGGTAKAAKGGLLLKLGQNFPIVGKTQLERWKWYSVRLECGARRIKVFLNDQQSPEIDIARPDHLMLPDQLFIGGRCDNDSNFEGRIDEVAFFGLKETFKVESQSTSESVPTEKKPQVSALDAIEAERGGRHWIDQKTEPPTEPADALKTFQIEEGFQLSLFASEPLVKDPVAITFDHHGDMYVVEYADYPVGKEGTGGLCRIVCLKDTDGDAKADQRIVFAQGLDFAHSLMAFRDGILVGAKTQILHLKDTDQDGIADERRVLFDGFQPAHPQMQIGMPVWGLDNRISCNYGPGSITASGSSPATETKETVRMARKDFWFDPVTLEFGSCQGLGQYGNTVDRWGNRFFCTNRNPIKTDFLNRRAASRNPNHTLARTEYDVAPSGGDSKVFPLRKMKSNYLSHAGTHTSACGTTAWLGPASSPIALQKQLQRSVFVCEPIGHLVTRTIVHPDQVPLSSERASTNQDFLASTDSWFRPSSLQTGPDGALYLADMYRLWVEHPKFLPAEIAERIDWRAGEHRGRIYRIVAKDQASVSPSLPAATTDDLISLLKSNNGWARFLGQRLLVENAETFGADDECFFALRNLLDHVQPETRLHALASLQGVGRLRVCEVLRGLNDEHSRVREFAARLASDTKQLKALTQRLVARLSDQDTRVRMQAAIALPGDFDDQTRRKLADLALRDGSNDSFADALLTACHQQETQLLEQIIAQAGVQLNRQQKSPILSKLAAAVGRSGQTESIGRVLSAVIGSNTSGNAFASWQVDTLEGLAAGLKKSANSQMPRSLAELMHAPPSSIQNAVDGFQRWILQKTELLNDRSAPSETRELAARLLNWLPGEEIPDRLIPLLSATESAGVQQTAVDALLTRTSGIVQVLNRWDQLRPTVRPAVLQSALRRADSTMNLLKEMQAGRVSHSLLTVDQRARLLAHSSSDIRRLAKEIYPTAISANRSKIVDHYKTALHKSGDAEAGAKVFAKSCAVCHRVGQSGQLVGPDLTDVRNRSALALLHEILDPNAKVEPRFTSCTVITTDGKTITGILSAESDQAVQLRCSGGKVEEIPRAQIEDFIVSQKSLMPEGLETEITLQQMSDLLAFLTQPNVRN